MKAKKANRSLAAAKNAIRPLFHSANKVRFGKHIQAARMAAQPGDWEGLCLLAEGNSGFPFPGLGMTFPSISNNIPDVRFSVLRPLNLEREVGLQVARLNHHSQRLTACLASLAEINSALASGSARLTGDLIDEHQTRFGRSLILLKKSTLAAIETGGLPDLLKRFRALTKGRERTAWALMCRLCYDMADPTLDPARSTRAWALQQAQKENQHHWYSKIVLFESASPPPGNSQISEELLRYSATSLLDTIVYLWRIRTSYPENAIIATEFSKLDPSLQDKLNQNFHQLTPAIPTWYRHGSGGVSDAELLRLTFFYSEYANLSIWRTGILYSYLNQVLPVRKPAGNPVYQELLSLSDTIRLEPLAAKEAIKSFSERQTLPFGKDVSLADQNLLSAAVSSTALDVLAGEEFDVVGVAALLSGVKDIHVVTSDAVLDRLRSGAKESGLLRFITDELKFRKTRNQDTDLSRRLSFMALFKGQDCRAVVPFLEALTKDAADVALLIADTCNRPFLEKLFLLVNTVQDVLETRLAICDWQLNGKSEHSDSLLEEVGALRRELDNLDARSDLDSTRVHVDEEGLRQWFHDTQEANVTRYIQTALAEGPSTNRQSVLPSISVAISREASTDEDDVGSVAEVGSDVILVAIVDAVMRAFSSDKTFGLDAYLSRRIRHGTLSGQLITPVVRSLATLKTLDELRSPEDLDAPSPLSRLVDDWQRDLTKDIDYVRTDVLQVRGPSKPHGLIKATWRTTVNAAHLDAMLARVHQRVTETQGKYDIFPDIYALCWDCLEPDLAQMRLFMARSFLPEALAKLQSLYATLPQHDQRAGHLFFSDACRKLESRVQEVCGWFIRPVFRRDTYDLKTLVRSTLSIVKDLDISYDFVEDIDIDEPITLSRGSFEIIGDALFVLVVNAAKHGSKGGKVKVSASLAHGDNQVIISVVSEVPDDHSYDVAVERIQLALDVERAALGRAAVEEGFSGLRKVAGIIYAVPSPNTYIALFGSDSKSEIKFDISLPRELSIKRKIG